MFSRLFIIISLFLLASCHASREITLIKNIEYGTYPSNQGNRKLRLDLYLPQQSKQKIPPVIIYIHGGGWYQNSKENCPGKQVAKRGFSIACVNYRYSSEALFPAQIEDVKQAVVWLRRNADKYKIDADNMGAWGDSAGGHLSALLGTSSGVEALEKNRPFPEISTKIQAVANWYGPTDFTQVTPAFEGFPTPEIIKKTKQKPWSVYTIATTKLLGGPVKQHQQLAALANPIAHIDSSDPPFLIVHGEQDTIVPISQSELLATALKNQGIEVDFVKISDMKHSYRGSKGESFDPKLIDMALTFFEKHLKSK